MRVFRFSNKRRRITDMWLTIITAIAAIIILLNVDIGLNVNYAFFLAALISFTYGMFLIKRAGKELEEILINDEEIKLYFFNKSKSPVIVNKGDFSSQVKSEKLIICYKSSGKQIGAANKNQMEDPHRWKELLDLLNSDS